MISEEWRVAQSPEVEERQSWTRTDLVVVKKDDSAAPWFTPGSLADAGVDRCYSSPSPQTSC